MSWIYLYDEDDRDLEFARRQLARHGVEELQLRTFSNRIELFEAIDAAHDTVVALVDLQSDERTDNNYSGHRVIETIRRHPRLRESCVAIVYTVHVREDVIALARAHGARAMISKYDLEVPDINLLGFLEEQRRRPPALVGADATLADGFPIFPGGRCARERLELQEGKVRAAVDFVVRGKPRILRQPYFWEVVRYFANGSDPTSVAHWIHLDFHVPESSVTKELDDLRQHLAPQYRVQGVVWSEFARDLLAKLPQMRVALAPSNIEVVRRLQRVSELEEILRDPAIREASYLDKAALGAIDRVVHPIMGVGHTSGHVGAWKHTDDLIERLAEVEPDEKARMTLQVDFVRGVTNMYDTYLASQSRG